MSKIKVKWFQLGTIWLLFFTKEKINWNHNIIIGCSSRLCPGSPHSSALHFIYSWHSLSFPTLWSCWSSLCRWCTSICPWSPSSQMHLVERIQSLSNSLHSWMASNRVCLNASKTQFIWFGTPNSFWRLILFSSWKVSRTIPFLQLYVIWVLR